MNTLLMRHFKNLCGKTAAGLHSGCTAVGLLLWALLAVVAPLASAQQPDAGTLGAGTITTFAGKHGSNIGSGVTDGQPAIDVPLDNSAGGVNVIRVNAVAVDSHGNVYFAAGGSTSNSPYAYVGMIYVGGTIPPLLKFRTASPIPLNLYYIVGPLDSSGNGLISDTICGAGAACGDGASALKATLKNPSGLAVDQFDNLYISDSGSSVIREVKASNGFIYTVVGDLKHELFGYSGENVPAKGAFLYKPTGIALDPAGKNLYIADTSNHLVRKVDIGAATPAISTVAGTPPPVHTDNGGTMCITALAPCGDGGPATNAQLNNPEAVFVTNSGKIYIADAFDHTVREVSNGTINTVAGQLLKACSAAPCGDGGSATHAQLNFPSFVYEDSLGNLLISDKFDNSLRVVNPSGDIATVVGRTLPNQGGYRGNNGDAYNSQLNTPSQFVFDDKGTLYIADQGNGVIRSVVPGTLKPQTITFKPIPNQTYGAAPLHLHQYASASSGLTLTYTVPSTEPATINGEVLTIAGVGTVAVTAKQNGNTLYAEAAPVTQTFTVNPAALTVSVIGADVNGGVSLVADTFPNIESQLLSHYQIAGYQGSDTEAVVKGVPAFSIVNSAGVVQKASSETLPTGTYTVNMKQGTLEAKNYTFKFEPFRLILTGDHPQTVSFGPFPDVTYGSPNSTFVLAATSSSGLTTFNYDSSGPVTIALSPTTHEYMATVTGFGAVSLTARQLGNSNYKEGDATATFQVIPAPLTVAANNQTVGYSTAIPPLTYTITGFVLSDTISVVSGTPALSTTATTASPPGQYPIVVTRETLAAKNYSFVFANGTLTVTVDQQRINFPTISQVAFNYGAGTGLSLLVPFTAVASSGLPVTCTSTGPITVDCTGKTITATGIGTASLTVTQAGNADYAPASATQSFSVVPGTVPIQANNVTMPKGGDIPQFSYTFPNGAPPANLYSGVPVLNTTATSDSPPGTYPIVISQGTLTSTDYTFQFTNGTLTVTPPASYTLSVNPTSVTIPSGQSRQVTILMTAQNGYAGSVTIGCSGLPTGVTCISSPEALTAVAPSNGAQPAPVQGTLTISAGQVVASKKAIDFYRGGTPAAAGLLCLPAGISCLLLGFCRRRLKRSSLFFAVFLGATLTTAAGSIIACGGASQTHGVTTGTTQITVTGTATAAPGTGNLNQSVSLTVIIQ